MSNEFASANLTVGQINAIVKRLGGEEGARGFLRGEFELVQKHIPRFEPTFIGKGWTFWRGPADGDGLRGKVDEDRRAVGRPAVLEWVRLETCQSGEMSTTGEERLRRLKTLGTVRAGGDQFRWFWEHQDQIPKEWGDIVVFFDGTVLRSPSGNRYTLCLYRGGGQWLWYASWLGSDRCVDFPSLLLAE